MEKFKERLIEFAREQYNMGQTRFEDYCELSHGTISSIKVKGPSADIVMKISVKCPELNLNWLFRGEEGGQMLNTLDLTTKTPALVNTIHTVNIGNLGDIINPLKEQLSELYSAINGRYYQ